MIEKVQIDPAVALCEMQALAEHYRNRSLVLAQALSAAEAAINAKDEEIARLRDYVAEMSERGEA